MFVRVVTARNKEYAQVVEAVRKEYLDSTAKTPLRLGFFRFDQDFSMQMSK